MIRLIVLVVMLVLVSSACGISGPSRPHADLGPDAAALRDAFNAAADRVRVVALVSPTCGACLRGASDIQEQVFGQIDDQRLVGFVVWVPELDGQEANVPEATRTVSDPRACHYWDGHAVLVRGYDRVLSLETDAWDIYLIYPPGVRWDRELPPAPTFWMHQLGSRAHPQVNGPYLDPQAFAQHVHSLLGRP
jgi:hypothetical protein